MSDVYEYNCGFLNAKCGGEAPAAFVGDTNPSEYSSHAGAYAVHDLNLSWNAPWDARISVGARNLFGKEPPVLYNSFAHSFDASYDLPGGAYWYMSYRQDF
jgi:outer membrane receptor protein involved in Fe transport